MKKVKHVILSGSPGSGKTVGMASFVPPGMNGQPHRLIVDMELRADEYRGDKDSPESLLWAFETADLSSPQSFISLMKSIRTGERQVDVFGIDNIGMFQDLLVGWFSDKQTADMVLNGIGIRQKYSMLFVRNSWPVGDPGWLKAIKSVISEMLLLLRKAGVSFIGTAQLRNKWQDYGKKGYAPDGMPWQRIVGQTTACWPDAWLPMVDAVLILNRMNRDKDLFTKPTATLDHWAPKQSIVGLPPQFTLSGWADVWKMTESRHVVTDEDLAKLERPRDEFPEDVQTVEVERPQQAEERPRSASDMWMELRAAGLYEQARKAVSEGQTIEQVYRDLTR